MAIHTDEVVEYSSGFDKEIDESSRQMMMDLVQIFQYQYPIKSTIREVVSNAIDAVRERDVARKIITGEAKEDDYFIRRDDPKFKDSNFDASYYDLKWLSNDQKVKIIYEEGGDLGKDHIRIVDPGTGLGGARLEGYFKLGYSTKRNSKLPLGKFGIGAKAGLSTGEDYYTVITRYNGKEFHFNVYSHKVDSIVPPLDLQTGKLNPSYTFKNGYTAHYIETKALNGTEVIIGSKKHKKQDYIDAVKSQLLYFDNVELILKKASGYEEKIPFKANILFEDDILIVSDNQYYSRPHMVINSVNYGFIDFKELELEDKLGNVGIKVLAEEVTINPSRESVVWNDRTKETIQNRFKQAAGVATKLIQKQLNDPDFFRWLRTFLVVRYKYLNQSGNDAISKLAGIVNLENLEPAFIKDPEIRAGRKDLLFPGMKVEKISLERKTIGGKTKNKMIRTDVKWITDMNSSFPIIITNERPGSLRLRYLATQYPDGYYLIRYPSDLSMVEKTGFREDDEADDNDKKDNWILDFDLKLLRTKLNENAAPKDKVTVEQLKRIRDKVVGYMEKSSIPTVLSTIRVPDGFNWTADDNFEEETVEEMQQAVIKEATPEEKRKLEQRVVLFTPRGFDNMPNVPYNWKVGDPLVKLYEWQKVEPKLVEVQNMEGDDIYYGTTDDEPLIHFVAALTRKDRTTLYRKNLSYDEYTDATLMEKYGFHNAGDKWKTSFAENWTDKADIILMKVAKDQVKHYTMYRHISEFFMREDGTTLTMSNKLTKWYTGKLINEKIQMLSFMKNFNRFNPAIQAKYNEIEKYWDENYRDIVPLLKSGKYFGMQEEAYEEMLAFQKNLHEFQEFVAANPDDTETIAKLSVQLFQKEYTNGVAVDPKIDAMLKELVEYAESVYVLLNQISPLTLRNSGIDPDLEHEIFRYLEFKGL